MKTSPHHPGFRAINSSSRHLLVVVVVSLSAGNIRAVDYNFGDNVPQPFSITASDGARAIGGALGNFSDNGWGSVYDRGSERDVTYIHFDLTQLSALSFSGDVSLSFPINAQWGGAINSGVIGTANSAWTYSYGGATPGFTLIGDSPVLNGNFNASQFASWTITGSTFAGLMANPAAFPGFAVTAGAGSGAHFLDAPSLTVTADLPGIRVVAATDWSAASYDNGTKTLSVAGSSDVTGGNVALAAGTTLAVTGSATLDSGNFAGSFTDSGTLAIGSSANQVLTGAIFGTGQLVKSGSGALTLSGNNRFSGGLTINGGTLIANRSAQDNWIHTLGYGPLTINDGGTLRTTSNWATSSEWNSTTVGAITVNQGGTWSIEAVGMTVYNGLHLNGGTITGTGTNDDWGFLHLKSDVTAGDGVTSTIAADTALNWGKTITVAADSRLNYSGRIHNQINTNGAITKAGTGTLALSGSNSYSGQTDIQAGTLVVSNNTALGPGGWNGGTMTWIRDGATLALQGGISLDEHMHLTGAGVGGLGALRSLGGNNALTMTFGGSGGGPGFGLDGNATIGVDADTFTVTGFYHDSGSYGITKVGAGKLVLTQEQAYTGGTIVNGGTLEVGGYGGHGRLQKVLTINPGGTVVTTGDGTGLGYYDQISQVNINGGLLTSVGAMHIWNITDGINMTGGTLQSNNGATDSGGAQLEWNQTSVNTNASSDTATIAGRIRMRNDHGYAGVTFNVADGEAATDLLVSAAVTEASGGMGITKTGAGTLVLGGYNTYTGNTVVEGGTLKLVQAAGGVPVTIVNPGFESPDYSGGAWNYLGDDGIVAWTMTVGGISSNGSPWVNTAPGGDQAGFIQNSGSISQSITINEAGRYTLSFQTANRPNYNASDLTVKIGTVTVGNWTASQLNSDGAFVTRTATAYLPAGTQTLTFQGAQVSGDSATAIDNVTLTSAGLHGRLTFVPGLAAVSNKLTGTGNPEVILDGELFIDLTAAQVANGNAWSLIDVANITNSYGTGFTVNSSLGAFTNNAGVWTRTDGANTWTFHQSTGVLSLAVTPADPFANWINTNWPDLTDKTAGGDPDHDGIPNLLEYVLYQGDPSVGNPVIQPTLDATGANFVFTIHRRAASTADTTQVFQYSTDMGPGSWTDVAIPSAQAVVTPDTPTTGIDEVVITIPKESRPTLFGRLSVTK